MLHWLLKTRLIKRGIDIVRTMSECGVASTKIAVCQMTSKNDKAENLNVVMKLVGDAVKEDAQMIFFPEACDYLCDNKKEMLSFAEPILGGETVTQYREIAKACNVWMSMGGLHEKDPTNPNKVYNTHVIINNEGDIVQTYRKLHLFDVEIPEKGVRLKESDFANYGCHVVTPCDTPIAVRRPLLDEGLPTPTPSLPIRCHLHPPAAGYPLDVIGPPCYGASRHKVYNTHVIINNEGDIVQTYRKLHLFDVEIPEKGVRLKESDFANYGCHVVTPCDTPIGKLGLAICYDMRFPELGCLLSSLGADVLTYPSAFTKATGEAHWEILLRSRAIENQCYVIAAAQVGDHNAKRTSYGQAICIDPWGTIIADCGTTDSPTYKIAEVSQDKLAQVRRNMPVFEHRRKKVYSLYALSLRQSLLPEHDVKLTKTPAPSDDPRNTFAGVSYSFGHVKVPETCIFYKSELTYAFVNLRCVIPGHVLVAPIRVALRNQDLTDEEATDFFKTVRIVQHLMETVHNTESCTVTIQDGPEAGQTVKHLHCHIMPRKKGDFIDNDLIYLELAKHDQLQASGHPAKPARTLQEMEEEASFLRERLKTIYGDNDISR